MGAFAYNVLQYTIVQSLTAAHTTFAGNFNKAATVALALILGMEQLPPGGWGVLMLSAILCNILAFTAYSVISERSRSSSIELQQVPSSAESETTEGTQLGLLQADNSPSAA